MLGKAVQWGCEELVQVLRHTSQEVGKHWVAYAIDINSFQVFTGLVPGSYGPKRREQP